MRWLLALFRRDFWVAPDPAEAGPVPDPKGPPGNDTPAPAAEYVLPRYTRVCGRCRLVMAAGVMHLCLPREDRT